MAICPSCSKEIMEGAVVCKHCGAKLGKPKRPTGVTVIGILSILGGVFGLIVFFASVIMNPYELEQSAIVLGIRVPTGLFLFIALLTSGLTLYCGFGFLQQKKLARTIYLYLGIYGIINTILSSLVVLGSGYGRRGTETGVMVVTLLITLAFYGVILRYVIRRKDYFVN